MAWKQVRDTQLCRCSDCEHTVL